MLWLSPTGHYDPASVWDNETFSYDKDINTFTECTVSSYEQPTGWLEHTIAEMQCSRVRFDAFYSAASVNEIELEIFTTVWVPVFKGSFADHTWVEKDLGGIKTLTKARERFYCIEPDVTLAKIYEFEFGVAGGQGSGVLSKGCWAEPSLTDDQIICPGNLTEK